MQNSVTIGKKLYGDEKNNGGNDTTAVSKDKQQSVIRFLTQENV